LKISHIQIDWLQIAYHSQIPLHVVDGKFFKLVAKAYGTSLFQTVYNVMFNDKEVAVLAANPRVDFLEKNFCMLKILNEQLYTQDSATVANQIAIDLQLKFNNVSRLDLCVDFNNFSNGLYPERLIKNFIMQGVNLLGKRKFVIHGKNLTEKKFDYLKFGNSTSDVVCYLYNKTLELSEVKMKPYIVESWKQQGIDINKPVWRLEFSIKNSNKHLISKETGEALNFKAIEILNKEFLHELFALLQHKYFRFKKITGQQNISREADVKLFDFDYEKFIFKGVYDKKDSNRFSRIIAKKINEFNNEVRLRSIDDANKIKEVYEMYVNSRMLPV